MKKCIRCGEVKPLEAFHKHKMMKDGHLNKCAKCVVQCVQAWRESQPAGHRHREYLRAIETGKRKRIAPQKYGIDPEARKRAAKKYSDQLRTASLCMNEFDAFVFYECRRLCHLRLKATGFRWQVDHIVPIGYRHASGLNKAANIQCIPEMLNKRKGNRSMDVIKPY